MNVRKKKEREEQTDETHERLIELEQTARADEHRVRRGGHVLRAHCRLEAQHAAHHSDSGTSGRHVERARHAGRQLVSAQQVREVHAAARMLRALEVGHDAQRQAQQLLAFRLSTEQHNY